LHCTFTRDPHVNDLHVYVNKTSETVRLYIIQLLPFRLQNLLMDLKGMFGGRLMRENLNYGQHGVMSVAAYIIEW
jgi:hypothetical protein